MLLECTASAPRVHTLPVGKSSDPRVHREADSGRRADELYISLQALIRIPEHIYKCYLTHVMTQTLAPTSFARQPLDVILARPTAIRVLRALILHGGPLSVARIAAEARLTPGGVRGVLDELVCTRIVQVLGSSRTQLYHVSSENPFYEPLRLLFDAEARRLDDLLQVVIHEATQEHPEVRAIWLFGSVARGNDTVESDLDIALVIDAADERISAIMDFLRPRVALHGERLGFQPSMVAIALRDIPKMELDGHRLWADFLAQSKTLYGLRPSQALERSAERVGA
jgi:predicted nucleotidyltransferase